MDIETFKGIKHNSTVIRRLKKDYISESQVKSNGQWLIPESARSPYTNQVNCAPDG